MAISLADSERLLSYIGPALAGVLFVRLAAEGLVRRYRFFALFLLCLVAEVVVLWLVPRNTNRYMRTYIWVESALWLIQVLVVIELFSAVVRDYKGIARSGRVFLCIAVVIAVAISAAVGAHHAGEGIARYRILNQYLLVARVLAMTVLVFLVTTVVGLLWFPVPLARNAVAYALGFTMYFTCRAVTRLIGTELGPDQILLLSTISESVLLCCLVFWIIFLTRRGEAVRVVTGRIRAPEQTRVLTDKLETINALLLRDRPNVRGQSTFM